MLGHGDRKFTQSALLASSADREWTSVAIDIRRHAAGPIAPFVTQNVELTVILRAAETATVFRAAHGVRQSAPALPGTTFVIPAGTAEEATFLTGAIPEVMHLYLSDALFADIAQEEHLPRFDRDNVRYVSGARDPTLNWLARSIAVEMRAETSGSLALVELLDLSLAERMVLHYTDGVSGGALPRSRAVGLDATRMRRVLDFIAVNLDQPISIADMASVACLSPFHFARAFRAASGKAPHQYLSGQRLNMAKRLLRDSDESLASIAAACRFSGQSSFTRAFTGAVGRPPGRFRRSGG